ncbi:helix-turn-helix domain-containing protein [Rhodovibrionaceae bacterium A322]
MPSPQEQPLVLAGQLVAAIGSEEFPGILARVIKQLAEIDSYVVLLFSQDHAPIVLHDLLDISERPIFYQRYLREGAFLLDPVFVVAQEQSKSGFMRVSDIVPDEFYQSEYYANYYLPSATLDEACYMQSLGDGRFLHISCGRLHKDHPFTVTEFGRMAEMAPVIQAAAAQHWKHVGLDQPREGAAGDKEQESSGPNPSRAINQVLESFGDGCLTERERQVALLLLRGHSSKSAARELDISPATERVHRRNIYLKLAVSSQAELCSRFFELLSR